MDIVGSDRVTLRAGTSRYPMGFGFTACSSATANDGSIPYSTTITAAAVIVLDAQGVDITSTAAENTIVTDGLNISCAFNYPSTAAEGRCKVLIQLTLSSGTVITKRWDGLYIGNN